jgi:hypothetical protein
VTAHVDDHVGDHRDGDEADDRFEALLPALRQVLVDDLEHRCHHEARADRERDPCPHPAQRVAATALVQERRHDPHDERRLDALAQPDDELHDRQGRGHGHM